MDNSDGNKRRLYIPIIINSVLGISNRIFQIIDYCLNNYKYEKYKFMADEIKKAGLIFCILPSSNKYFYDGTILYFSL